MNTCPSNDPFYSVLFNPRNVGAETYYKKGYIKLSDGIHLHCYIDNNKCKRLTLTVNGCIVSGISLDQHNYIKCKATKLDYMGNRYTQLISGLAKVYFGISCKASDYLTLAGKACY